ncbi:DHH family phosphoesterase [Candidatus Micrarchaeota archaeon]|nr:DHH family phosphoesterase [Candidatus Micrarchaeota archaeon]
MTLDSNITIFKNFLKKYGNKRIAVVTHNKADVDALSSAFALSSVLPNSIICTDEDMKNGADALCERLKIKVHSLPDFEQFKDEFAGIIVTDTGAYTMCPATRDWKILCIVDHHQASGRDMKAEFEIFDDKSPSAAEIVANLIDPKQKDVCFALSVGIIADGARFKSARQQTFETLGRLMKIADAPYGELLSYAEPEPKPEAKAAILSCLSKSKSVYVNDYFVATSETISNESDAASALTEAADVAFVAKWNDEFQETRVGARARRMVSVPMNEVMSLAAKSTGGSGGGHPKAAGGAFKCHTQEALEKCIETFEKLSRTT